MAASDNQRPDPDRLLKRVQAEEAQSKRAKLKLFFGANPGVGKTYSMLEAARQRKKEGVDVVVGVVETHGRSETAALLEGLDVLPRQEIEYKGITLKEFDIDAALARKPQLLLVDELAHTNAPGVRHAKRWQDVEELLNAGISVYTTLNVQHWESLKDVVAQITGVVVRESVPDTLLQRSHDIELVDLSPEDLLQRLKDGKVYMGEQADRAADNFFKPANLVALRELALRHVAERVDAQMLAFQDTEAPGRVRPVRDRLLVGVTPSPLSPRLVRATHRLATQLRSEWVVANVETPSTTQRTPEERSRLLDTLRMAENLGAETVTLTGSDVSSALLSFAFQRKITKIILGKPARPRWREWLQGSVVNEMARRCGNIDLYVISGMGTDLAARRPVYRKKPISWKGSVSAAGFVALCTLINWPLFHVLDRVNLAMIYLLGVMWIAYKLGRTPALVSSVLSVLAFDFFYVPPYFTFAVSDTQYLLTFAVMFGAGFLISTLAGRLSLQAETLQERELRTRMFYKLSRELSETPDPKELLQRAWKHLSEFYAVPVLIFIPDGNKGLRVAAGDAAVFELTAESLAAADWVYLRGEAAGTGTDTLAGTGAMYMPLRGLPQPVGVLAIKPSDPLFFKDPEQLQILETLASEIGGALESTRMTESAGRSEAEIETQRLRNLLLTTFSADLRGPMARLSRKIGECLHPPSPLTDEAKNALLKEIKEESERLTYLADQIPELLDFKPEHPASKS